MGKHYFTDEQVNELRLNPHVKNVTNKGITYTEEFRNFFVEEYERGLLPRQILRDAGFDPEMLGKQRIDALSARFKKMVVRPEGATDNRKNMSGRPKTKDLTPEEEIQRLKHKVKYLEQENDFLKKIRFLDGKAQSAQNQKKST